METKELARLVLSKRIRKKIDQDLSEVDDKTVLLVVYLIIFENGKPPLLEGDTTEDKPAKVKVEPLNLTEKKVTEEAQGVNKGKC